MATLLDVSLESRIQNHHERHLHVNQLNLKTAEGETNSTEVNSNFGRNISLENDLKSQNMVDLKCLEMKGGEIGLKAATPKKGGGLRTKTPIKTPRRNVAKVIPKSKPHTPEFKRILERIKNKKKEKAQNTLKSQENGQILSQKSEQKNKGNQFKLNVKVVNEIKERPPFNPPSPKIGVGGGKKRRGKKHECVQDENQPKIDDLWVVKLQVKKKET